MNLQRTLRSRVTITGVGLHSGKPATLVIKPASPNTGVVFVRTDLKTSPRISAHYKNIVSTQLATTLGLGEVTIGTVEHVLAALQGMGVDNALIEVDGPEVPILDGSAIRFCEAIEDVGLHTQPQMRSQLVLRNRVEVRLAEKWAIAEPSSRFEIHGSIEWDHPAIGFQEFHYVEGTTSFSQIANSRTFGFLQDVEALKRMGLARGGSLDNAVVLDQGNVLNPDGLRHPDEFVRHKVLDALGDFKLSGIAMQGYFRLHRAGHDLHGKLLAEIFSNPNNYEIISGPGTDRRLEERQISRLRAGLARRLTATVS